jgi:hypothetical protein
MSATDGYQGGAVFKTVMLLKRRPGMSMDDFIAYYEDHHTLIGKKYLAGFATHYVRRYVTPFANPVTGAEIESPYDVITETWYPDQTAFAAAMAIVGQPGPMAEIAADEENFLDRPKNLFFTVHEHVTPLPPPARQD